MTHQIIFDRSVDRCSMQLGNDKKKERSALVRFWLQVCLGQYAAVSPTFNPPLLRFLSVCLAEDV